MWSSPGQIAGAFSGMAVGSPDSVCDPELGIFSGCLALGPALVDQVQVSPAALGLFGASRQKPKSQPQTLPLA